MDKLQRISIAASPNARSNLDPRFSFDRRTIRRSRGFLDHAEFVAVLNGPVSQESDAPNDGSAVPFPAEAVRLQGRGFICGVDASAPRSKQDRKAHVTRILSKVSAVDADRKSQATAPFGLRKTLLGMSETGLQELEDELDFFAFTDIRGEWIQRLSLVAEAGGENEEAPPERGFWSRLMRRFTSRRP